MESRGNNATQNQCVRDRHCHCGLNPKCLLEFTLEFAPLDDDDIQTAINQFHARLKLQILSGYSDYNKPKVKPSR